MQSEGLAIAVKRESALCSIILGLLLLTVFVSPQEVCADNGEENTSPLSIEFSTLLGGNGEDGTGRVALDSQGNIVLASKSPSTDFPILNAYQPAINGSDDGVITKLSPDGQELVFSTFFGGSAGEYIYTVAVDSNDDIVIAGTTASVDFPLKNAIKTSWDASSREVFLAKFSSDGQELNFSTYICGTSTWVVDIGIDDSDNIILAGSTDIDYLASTEGSYQPSKNSLTDTFVTKISSDGQSVLFSTFLGGNGFDDIRGMALDSSGNIIVTGYTDSEDFPQVRSLCNRSASAFDNYVGKLSADGKELLFSSYYGGTREWGMSDLSVDRDDNILLVGETNSMSFPLVEAYQDAYAGGETDGFVVKIDGVGYSIDFSTFFGGARYDGVHGVLEDKNGDLIITGSTASSDLPTLNPYQTYKGAHEAFICRMTEDGQLDDFSSYFGGSGFDYSFGSALDVSTNSIILFGHTSSNHSFPLVNAYQIAYKGGDFDMFVCKFTIAVTPAVDTGLVVVGLALSIVLVIAMVVVRLKTRPDV